MCKIRGQKILHLVAPNTGWGLLTGSLSEGQAEAFNRGLKGRMLPSQPGEILDDGWLVRKSGQLSITCDHFEQRPVLNPAVGLFPVLYSKPPSLGLEAWGGGKW